MEAGRRLPPSHPFEERTGLSGLVDVYSGVRERWFVTRESSLKALTKGGFLSVDVVSLWVISPLWLGCQFSWGVVPWGGRCR